jgi:AAA15 family ATPase/GTPase
MEGYEEIFLSFLQVEDENITQIETTLGDYQLLIHRKEQETAEKLYFNSQPSNLGRLAIMAATLIGEQFLSIDEIENGLHYSQYEKLWITIFEAVHWLGEAQVVATTHSLEMIKAFVKVSLLLEEQNGISPSNSYVEIAVTADTDELIAIKRDAETVIYALERGKGIRGEMMNESPEVKFSKP